MTTKELKKILLEDIDIQLSLIGIDLSEEAKEIIYGALFMISESARQATIQEIREHMRPLADMESALREIDKIAAEEKV